MNNYYTDDITNMICQYYHGEISKKKAFLILQELYSEQYLAQYILDSFDNGILHPQAIEKIPIKEEDI